MQGLDLSIKLGRSRRSGGPAVVLPVTFSGTVATEENGQSNVVGTNNIDGNGANVPLPDAVQGQYDRVQLVNAAHLNDALQPEWAPLQIVKSGQTVDGVVGLSSEFGAPNGISSVSGMGFFVDDTDDAEGTLFPGADSWRVLKNGSSGTPQTNWIPDGGGFNSSDAIMRQIFHDYIAANETRFAGFFYGQGEAEAEAVSSTLEASQSSTDPDVILPLALADSAITGWAEVQADTRRAKREYFGNDQIPYVILGVVLPDRGAGDSYNENAERLREAINVQYKNMARYEVILSEDGNSITVNDLGLNTRTITYDGSGTDTFTETVTGTASPLKDNRTFLIQARGFESPDSLHHGTEGQRDIGKARKLLMEYLYGPGGNPPASQTVTEVKPIFYEPLSVTGVSDTAVNFTFMPSEDATLHVAAYAAGAPKPSPSDVTSGINAEALVSLLGARRTAQTGTLGGLSPETAYDIYAVLEYQGITGAVPDAVSVNTTEEVTSPWSIVGASTFQLEAQGTAGETQSIAIPADIALAEDDLVLVFMAADVSINQSNANEGVATAGYTQEFTFSGNPGAYFGWTRLSVTPDSSVDVYRLSKRVSGVIQVWRGANQTAALDTAVLDNVGSGPTPTAPALTTISNNALRVVVGFLDDDDAASVTAPSGYGNLAFTGTSLGINPGGSGATVMVASRDGGPAGSEAPGSFVTDGSDSWRAIHIALRPA